MRRTGVIQNQVPLLTTPQLLVGIRANLLINSAVCYKTCFAVTAICVLCKRGPQCGLG
jgi:hypothetical protein